MILLKSVVSQLKSDLLGALTRRQTVTLLALPMVLSGIYFGVMLHYTGGHLSAPLDDTIIYYQYGRQLASLKFFQYNDEDGYSTGTTSFTYPFLVAAGFWLGFEDAGMFLYTFTLGWLLLTVAGFLTFHLTTCFAPRKVAFISAILFLLSGPMLLTFLAGMETGLFICLILASLLAYDRGGERRRFLLIGIMLALLALTRPEGFAIAVGLSVLVGIEWLVRTFLLRDRAPFAGKRLWPFLLPCAASAGYFLLNLIMTGHTAPNTMIAKSEFYNVPFRFWDTLSHSSDFFIEMLKGSLIGVYSVNWAIYFPPFMGLAFLLGIGALAGQEVLVSRKLGTATVAFAWFMAGLWVTSLSFVRGWMGTFRYQIPFFSILIIFAPVGVELLSRKLLPEGVSWRGPFYGVCAFFLVFTLLTTGIWAVRFGENCENIYDQQVTLGRWIDRNLPEHICLGLNDAGALKYFGKRYVHDFIGLVTNEEAFHWRHGMGSVFERLENLDEGHLPDFLAIYPDWFKNLRKTGLLGEEIHRVSLRKNTVCGAPTAVVYKPDWSLLHSGDKMYEDHNRGYRRVIDSLDTADLPSEALHDYEIHTTRPIISPGNVLRRFNYVVGDRKVPVVDGGRFTEDYEAMTVRGIEPDNDLLVVVRVEPIADCHVEFELDGIKIGRTMIQQAAHEWEEIEFLIPARFVRSDTVRLVVRALEGGDYSSFHYWFLQ